MSSRVGPSPPSSRATRFARSGVLATRRLSTPLDGEVPRERLRGARLVAGRVDGVEPEKLLEERRDLLAEAHSAPALERAVSSFRTSQSSGKITVWTRRPSTSTGVPWVPTTASPITRATTR